MENNIVEFRDDGKVLNCLILVERLDTAGMALLEKCLNEKTKDFAREKLLLDLSKVAYVCSSFLRICVALSRSLGTEKFCIANPSPEVKKVFKIANMSSFFKIAE